MNEAQKAEAADNAQLRKACEFVAHCQQQQSDAIRALADANKQVAFARERYNALFSQCERRASYRRHLGAIPCNAVY